VYNGTTMSYYAKYRPQTIEELDLAAVRDSLTSILTSGKFSHAYLFTGPKGTGKTSSARIVAKVLNCEKNISSLSEPCNECENCRRITAGSSLSCIEMDAASNRGIDDIRMLRERVGLSPAEGRYAVYIIDEVHMLTTEAFNALLKTLEEPPEHAVFILCTTDPQKIPDTVISRCTRVHFLKATPAEVAGSLEKAIKGEKLELEKGSILKIAEAVDGSFRDGMKLLEQLAQQAAGKIGLSAVLSAVGASEDYDPQKLYESLLGFDASVALSDVNKREKSGVDLSVYGKRLLELIRARLIEAVSLNNSQMQIMIELADAVDQAVVKMKSSVLPQLVFEAMVVRWCTKQFKHAEYRRELSEVKPEKIQKQIEEKQPTYRIEHKPEKKTIQSPEVVIIAKDFFQGKLEEVHEKWQVILAAVKPLNHSLEALLRSARPKSVDNGILKIEAFYKFHKEQLEQDRHRQQLEDAMGAVLGGRIRLEIVLGERTVNKAEVAAIENISGAVEDDALVRAAEEIFS
jgi:DNA polymerase III subunit gamma/tau